MNTHIPTLLDDLRAPASGHPRPVGPLTRSGKARTAILLWLLGVPIPLILIFFLIRGCMG